MGELATAKDVSRLFARAGFGADATTLDYWTGKKYADAVDSLVNVPDPTVRVPAPDEPMRLALENGVATEAFGLGDTPLRDAQEWWLERMRTTLYPLEERMTLFLHDHFATSFRSDYPTVPMMMQQNQLLRRFSLGNFRDLCAGITLDPAMLFWLNGTQNIASAPNENYAREFFELFTLGKRPQIYSETDVRESARVLTGWICDPTTRQVTFVPGRHDHKSKMVLGTKIADDGSTEFVQIVDLALAQPVSYRFVAWKLVSHFAYVPVITSVMDPTDPLIVDVANALKSSNWDLKAALRVMLMSDLFRYAKEVESSQSIRQPIELVVSLCKALNIRVTTNQPILQLLSRMGQVPFLPPNVGGWPFGMQWLSAVTSIARYDWGIAAYNLSLQRLNTNLFPPASSIDAWVKLFGLDAISSNTRSAITSYLQQRPVDAESDRQAGVLALLAMSPEWMVI
ncbi:MAG: DUF1800 domain-containing protein [Actinomycetota bacterium]